MLIQAIIPVLNRKSVKLNPNAVPMIMLGGSPLMVAAPPTFDANISAIIIGTGSNFSIRESSIVTEAINSITVILSMNMAKAVDKSIKAIRMGTIL